MLSTAVASAPCRSEADGGQTHDRRRGRIGCPDRPWCARSRPLFCRPFSGSFGSAGPGRAGALSRPGPPRPLNAATQPSLGARPRARQRHPLLAQGCRRAGSGAGGWAIIDNSTRLWEYMQGLEVARFPWRPRRPDRAGGVADFLADQFREGQMRHDASFCSTMRRLCGARKPLGRHGFSPYGRLAADFSSKTADFAPKTGRFRPQK